jgi:5-methyltetrahydropteroyltriglutamate--homocysteine methyltransferase
MLAAKEQGQPVDEPRAARLPGGEGDRAKQIELGIDIVDDGEYRPTSSPTSTNAGGFEIDTIPPRALGRLARGAVVPGVLRADHVGSRQNRMVCTGPITYKGHALCSATSQPQGRDRRPKVEAFMPAISPSNIEEWQRNTYYKTQEEYVVAIAEAMREEYKAIVDAGLLLQIDDPRLVSYYLVQPGASIAECRKWARTRIDVLNHALRGIPPEKIRHHTCYGINMGPRVHDIEVKHLLDIILKINAGAGCRGGEPAPRARMEDLGNARLPKDKVLIPA